VRGKSISSYTDSKETERKGRIELVEFFSQVFPDTELTFFDKGKHVVYLQKNYGDGSFTHDGNYYIFELKTEEERKWGNFFLEAWSNMSHQTKGWIHYINPDCLYYNFLEEEILYIIPWDELKEWAFDKKQIGKYDLKAQNECDQLNDTWGHCVPIEIITAEVPGVKTWQRNEHGRFNKLY